MTESGYDLSRLTDDICGLSTGERNLRLTSHHRPVNGSSSTVDVSGMTPKGQAVDAQSITKVQLISLFTTYINQSHAFRRLTEGDRLIEGGRHGGGEGGKQADGESERVKGEFCLSLR